MRRCGAVEREPSRRNRQEPSNAADRRVSAVEFNDSFGPPRWLRLLAEAAQSQTVENVSLSDRSGYGAAELGCRCRVA